MANKKPQTLSFANFPSRLPLTGILVIGLLLDRVHAPGWLWGACGTIMFFLVVGVLYQYLTAESVDIFKRVDALEQRLDLMRGAFTTAVSSLAHKKEDRWG